MIYGGEGSICGKWSNYRYELTCVVDGGFLNNLFHEGSFGIGGGAGGGIQGVHSGGGDWEEELRRVNKSSLEVCGL